MVVAGVEGRGVPGTRPLAKKRERAGSAVVQAVNPNVAQLLGEATSADVLHKGGTVREQVVRGVVVALPHVPAETQALGLDPVMRDPLEGASVLGGGWFAGGRWSRRSGTARLCGGGEGGEEPGSILGPFQVLLQEVPVVPLELPVLPGAEGHVSDPEDLVPVGGERHLEEGVGKQELAGEFGVQSVGWALGEDLSQHPAGELDFVHGPVLLGVRLAAGHRVEALVGPLHHPLDHAGARAVLA